VTLPAEIAVDAEVDLGLAQGGHQLAARLNINLPGIDEQTARSLVDSAGDICPYSLATKGNIDVTYDVVTTAAVQATGQVQHA
jgi:organic hydroperoxide reductase OsmC/OhrA